MSFQVGSTGGALFLGGLPGTASIRFGADAGVVGTITNSTTKRGQIAIPHYTNAQAPVCVIASISTSTDNTVAIGGGSTTLSAATIITLITASTNTNIGGGTIALTIDSSQKATFANAITISATSNHLVLTTSSNTLTISAATQATSPRIWSVPDVSGNGTFAALEGSQTFTGSKTFSSTSGNPIHGNTASPAAPAAGNIGETFSASATFTNFPTSTQWGDLTTITLTAGYWMIVAFALQIQNGATVTNWSMGISVTTGNSSTGLTDGSTSAGGYPQNNATGSSSATVFMFVTPSTSTIYYLKYNSNYTGGPPQAAGSIRAVRIG